MHVEDASAEVRSICGGTQSDVLARPLERLVARRRPYAARWICVGKMVAAWEGRHSGGR